GMKLDVTVLPAFNDLFTTIDNNNADVVSGGISITDARKVTYDFSSEIFEGAISLAIRKDSYKA
ncbi:MAG: transporter substrate-binding domain-containing protein, partial [Coprobacillus sp.]|nr:transporter substrate-binding domain-containing protein [Coprobacillus sp.]